MSLINIFSPNKKEVVHEKISFLDWPGINLVLFIVYLLNIFLISFFFCFFRRKRVNTLNHYRVPDGALLTLVPKQSSMYNISTMSDKSDRHLYHKYETLNLAKMGSGGGISGGGINHSPPLSRATSPLNHDYDNGLKVWHLVRHEWDNDKDGERHNKMVSEIYLTRLLGKWF